MDQRTLNFGRLFVAASFVYLSACGGDADDAAPATAPVSESSTTTLAAQVQTSNQVTSALPRVFAAFKVEIYSNVSQPMKLSFGRDGALYVGRQGGNVIHRVAPGGSSVSEFGPPMVDPDAVLVDAAGLISGVPNSVLVGGGRCSGGNFSGSNIESYLQFRLCRCR